VGEAYRLQWCGALYLVSAFPGIKLQQCAVSPGSVVGTIGRAGKTGAGYEIGVNRIRADLAQSASRARGMQFGPHRNACPGRSRPTWTSRPERPGECSPGCKPWGFLTRQLEARLKGITATGERPARNHEASKRAGRSHPPGRRHMDGGPAAIAPVENLLSRIRAPLELGCTHASHIDATSAAERYH
jgi:hypothetical protein